MKACCNLKASCISDMRDVPQAIRSAVAVERAWNAISDRNVHIARGWTKLLVFRRGSASFPVGLTMGLSELAVFDARLHIRVRCIDEPA